MRLCGVLLVIALTKTKKSLEQKEYKCSIYKGFGGGGRVGAAFGEKCEKTQKSAQNLRAFAFLLHFIDWLLWFFEYASGIRWPQGLR